MSLTLPPDHVRSPWENGMVGLRRSTHRLTMQVEGVVQADPFQYAYVAYRLPHGYTWFAGPQAREGIAPAYGGYVHFLQSSVQMKEIPPKDDREVAAVTYAGYALLHRGELQVSLLNLVSADNTSGGSTTIITSEHSKLLGLRSIIPMSYHNSSRLFLTPYIYKGPNSRTDYWQGEKEGKGSYRQTLTIARM